MKERQNRTPKAVSESTNSRIEIIREHKKYLINLIQADLEFLPDGQAVLVRVDLEFLKRALKDL